MQIVEAQFKVAKIEPTDQFYYIIANLQADVVSKIPTETFNKAKYAILKQAIINIYEKIKPELFETLVSEQLNSRKTVRKVGSDPIDGNKSWSG